MEVSLDGANNRLDYAVAAGWVDATFQSPFTLANGANSSCIAANGAGNGCAGVLAQAGDKIPGIPALTLKLRMGYALTPQTRLKATLQAQGPQYARGDENNQDNNGRVPGFTSERSAERSVRRHDGAASQVFAPGIYATVVIDVRFLRGRILECAC